MEPAPPHDGEAAAAVAASAPSPLGAAPAAAPAAAATAPAAAPPPPRDVGADCIDGDGDGDELEGAGPGAEGGQQRLHFNTPEMGAGLALASAKASGKLKEVDASPFQLEEGLILAVQQRLAKLELAESGPDVQGGEEAQAQAVEAVAEEEEEEEVDNEAEHDHEDDDHDEEESYGSSFSSVNLEKLVQLDEEYAAVQKEYFEERRQLEHKYLGKYGAVFRRRFAAIQGEAGGGGEGGGEAERIPGFWLHAMLNNSVVAECIAKDDVPVLETLIDVRCCAPGLASSSGALGASGASATSGASSASGFGFRLEFEFAADNPYFANSTLSKTYRVPNLFGNKLPVLESAEGTDVAWRSPEVNLQRRRVVDPEDATGSTTIMQRADSFFNFFDAPWMKLAAKLSPGELDDEAFAAMHAHVASDFRVGYEFFTNLVPDALHWFTGEAALDDDDDEEEEEEEDEDEEEEGAEEGEDGDAHGEEDEDEDADEMEAVGGEGSGAARRRVVRNGGDDAQDCKQQ